ncbi:uncharacterized protein LOC143452327 isoform X1 [Clavelina lepadiformis]|uniref:uncharacterized protein LOC143452327 isoform X1 n=1 Tax=Clavelina lepadiformis TaxID=159417 RepID=UPI004041D0B2
MALALTEGWRYPLYIGNQSRPKMLDLLFEYEVAVKKIAMEMGFKQVLTIISSPWSRLSCTTSLHV